MTAAVWWATGKVTTKYLICMSVEAASNKGAGTCTMSGQVYWTADVRLIFLWLVWSMCLFFLTKDISVQSLLKQQGVLQLGFSSLNFYPKPICWRPFRAGGRASMYHDLDSGCMSADSLVFVVFNIVCNVKYLKKCKVLWILNTSTTIKIKTYLKWETNIHMQINTYTSTKLQGFNCSVLLF